MNGRGAHAAHPLIPTLSETLVFFAAVAVATSLLESAVLLYLKLVEHRFLFVPRAVPWMIPLFHFVVVMVGALVVRLISRHSPVLGSWRVLGFLGGFYAALNALLSFHPRLHIASILLFSAGAGAVLSRRLANRAQRRDRVRQSSRALVAAVLVVVLGVAPASVAFAHGVVHGSAAVALPNVVLIILDTVRGDHLSALGYDRPTTPNLDRLARGGVLFEKAVAPAPWTLPSHATVLTGQWPFETDADWESPLSGDELTLTELLLDAGYQTAGFSANTRFVSYETGLAQGFEHFEDYSNSPTRVFLATSLGRFLASQPRLRGLIGNEWDMDRRSATDIRTAFTDWLDGRDRERPFFAMLNIFDAHHPYEPPDEFAGRFGSDTTDVSLLERLRTVIDPEPQFRTDPAGLDMMVRAYDESLAALDTELGRLLEELARTGALDETIIIVTADHGEHFGESGLVEHGSSLYYPVLHVPLIVAWADGIAAGERIAQPVSLRDLPATILDLAGIDPGEIPGATLRGVWETGRMAGTSPALSTVSGLLDHPPETPISRGDMAAVLVGSHVLIRNGDCQRELYDVVRDPRNEHDLGTLDRARLDRLSLLLDSLAPAKALGEHRCGSLERR